jgi:hypothetical protein
MKMTLQQNPASASAMLDDTPYPIAARRGPRSSSAPVGGGAVPPMRCALGYHAALRRSFALWW